MAEEQREQRPDPDALLQQVQAEERKQARGKLKVFFGMSAGVGKTYAMLEAARAKKAMGVDVLIGVVETHSRRETEALLQGLEVLPRKVIDYRGTQLREFNLEAALTRRPELILVDELAHTNAPGAANAKRWQDIVALLDAGINVFTTVNVQHIESLNDVVAKITGIVVRETVPDSILEQADEIEIIDLAPDDLLQRIKEGKVYLAEQAGRAAENFFKKGNLIALREMALRRTVERVNAQVQSFRQEQAISAMWPTSERLLVCVGPSPFSGRLIRAARRMAAGLQCKWIAAYVERPGAAAIGAQSLKQLQANLRLAEQLGAEVRVLTSANLVESLVEYARSRNITKIIIGKPLQPRWKERIFGSIVDELVRRSGDIDVYVIKGASDQEEETAAPEYQPSAPLQSKNYLWTALVVFICTILGQFMFPYFELSNINMVYLLGVALVATRLGRGPAILASIASVAAFDFFFVPPYHTFAVADTQYLVTFAVMLVVALLTGSLTAQIRRQVESTGERERRTAALYSMSRELSSARGVEKLLQITARHVAEVFSSDVVGLLPEEDGRLEVLAGHEGTFPFDARERSVGQWVFDTGQRAGFGTNTLPSAVGIYLPLNSTHGPLGVLGVHPRAGGRPLTSDQLDLLETFANQAALAIECDRLTEEARRAHVQAETEKMRSGLLSSVSHDLRTPLAAISGAAGTLLDPESKLNEVARRDLVETISDESERLGRLVSNLLEMTKLESGAAHVQKELCPLEEIVGSALRHVEKALSGRKVITQIPRELPIVAVDVTLMEQVFINLLENATKYTPPKTPIEVSASKSTDLIKVDVADRGPGIPSGDAKRIFDKFYRGTTVNASRGTGLGLAICRAIVDAHGGKIWVNNREGGGAVFSFTLPISQTPST